MVIYHGPPPSGRIPGTKTRIPSRKFDGTRSDVWDNTVGAICFLVWLGGMIVTLGSGEPIFLGFVISSVIALGVGIILMLLGWLVALIHRVFT